MADVYKLLNINFPEINYDKTCCVPFSISKIKSFKLNEVLKVHDIKKKT